MINIPFEVGFHWVLRLKTNPLASQMAEQNVLHSSFLYSLLSREPFQDIIPNINPCSKSPSSTDKRHEWGQSEWLWFNSNRLCVKVVG